MTGSPLDPTPAWLLIAAGRAALLQSIASGLDHDLRNVGQIATMGAALKPGDAAQLPGNPLAGIGRGVENARRRLALLLHGPNGAAVPIPLTDVLDAVRDLHTAQRDLAAVAVTVEAAAGLPAVAGTRSELVQAVLHLVTNAKEAGGPVRVSATADHDAARLTVDDSGPGLAAGDVEQLFAPGHTTKAGHEGVGLAAARAIAARYGGAVRGEPGPGGRGARFVLSLPVWGRR